mgnify:CR=1 FL=1
MRSRIAAATLALLASLPVSQRAIAADGFDLVTLGALGGIQDGKMVLAGNGAAAGGGAVSHRITWTPNADGSVRQHWESTDASGKWTTAFDGKYTRKAAP